MLQLVPSTELTSKIHWHFRITILNKYNNPSNLLFWVPQRNKSKSQIHVSTTTHFTKIPKIAGPPHDYKQRHKPHHENAHKVFNFRENLNDPSKITPP